MDELTIYEKLELEPAFETFKVFHGVRSHFNYENYDWEDYGPQSNLKFDNFLKNKHRWQYVKLGRQNKKLEMLIAHCAANFMANPKFHVRSAFTKKSKDVTKKYISENEDFDYNFKNWVKEDLQHLMREKNQTSFKKMLLPSDDGTDPLFMQMMIDGEIPMWLMIALDRMIGFKTAYNNRYSGRNPFWDDLSFKLKKAYPFYVYDVKETRDWFTRTLKRNGVA